MRTWEWEGAHPYPKTRPPRRLGMVSVLALAVLSIAWVSYIVVWASDGERSSNQLTPKQAREIATDPAATTDNRKRAIHRLSKVIAEDVRTIYRAGQIDPALHDYANNILSRVEEQAKGGN